MDLIIILIGHFVPEGVLRIQASRPRRAGHRHGQVGLRRLQRRPSAQRYVGNDPRRFMATRGDAHALSSASSRSHDPADGGGGGRQGFGLLHLQGRGAGAGPAEDAPPAGGGGGDCR